jgi:geranylgeranyl diphosphate synthase type II
MNSGAGDLDLAGYLKWCRTHVDAVIDQSLFTLDDSEGRLIDAMRYAILGGGKRLRPALVLLACEASGKRPEAALPAAAAIEMIHTYSMTCHAWMMMTIAAGVSPFTKNSTRPPRS